MLNYFSNASTEVGLSYFIRVLQQVSFTNKGEGKHVVITSSNTILKFFQLLFMSAFWIKLKGLGQYLSFLISDAIKNKI